MYGDSSQTLRATVNADHGKGLDDEDLSFLTNQRVVWPFTSSKLVNTMANCHVIKMLFGKQSYTYKQLKDLQRQLRLRQNLLQHLSHADKERFGAIFLHQVHIRFQEYLRSCNRGKIRKSKKGFLVFDNLIWMVDTNLFNASSPGWLNELMQKKEEAKEKNKNKNRNKNNNGGSNPSEEAEITEGEEEAMHRAQKLWTLTCWWETPCRWKVQGCFPSCGQGKILRQDANGQG